jgi:signal transduction histidine kinase
MFIKSQEREGNLSAGTSSGAIRTAVVGLNSGSRLRLDRASQGPKWSVADAELRAMTMERRRIGAELHDVVGQAVTVMTLQASGARAVLSSDPGRAAEALAVIEATGLRAMDELRMLLADLLPHDQATDRPIPAFAPRPGLRQLPALLKSIGAAGVDVVVEEQGRPRLIDSSVDSAAYRVISEALVNVVKHAGPGAQARVGLRWGPQVLQIVVDNSGRGSAGGDGRLSTGHGLCGLAERLDKVGGVLASHRTATGGYQVRAALPIPTSRIIDSSDRAAPAMADGRVR